MYTSEESGTPQNTLKITQNWRIHGAWGKWGTSRIIHLTNRDYCFSFFSSIQAVPAQNQTTAKKTHGGKLSFEEFENHTEDAWDATEDDLLRAALAKLDAAGVDQVRTTSFSL